jgi:hypothetical protein
MRSRRKAFNQATLLVCNDPIFGSGYKPSLAGFTSMILFAMAGMAIFLVRLAPHAGHASLTTMAAVDLPAFGFVFDQQLHGIGSRALPV